MFIAPLETNDLEAYGALAAERGVLFNRPEWTRLFEDRVRHFGFFDKGRNLRGGFILYEERRLGMPFFRNPPFTPTIGPFFKIDSSSPANLLETKRSLLVTLAHFLREQKYAVMSLSLNQNVDDLLPFIWSEFKVIPGYTYVLDLSKDVEVIFGDMASVRRRNIRRAEKDGLVVRKESDNGIVESLVLKTFQRQNKKLDGGVLRRILFEFAGDDNSYAFVTYRDGAPIASVFCLHDTKRAYYLLGGYEANGSHNGAGAAAMWEGIKHAKELGLKEFDFEGSLIPPIERYFRGFGGRLKYYFTLNKALFPLEIVLKLIKRERF